MTPREIHDAKVAKAASRPIPQNELLTSTRLQLSPAVRKSRHYTLRVLMRSPAGRRPLVLTFAQAAILTDYFTEPSTVPDALARLLGNRDNPPWTTYGCPPLSEYYELVLQAYHAGVLLAQGAPEKRSPAFTWPVRVPVGLASSLSTLVAVASMGAVAVAPFRWPLHTLDWVVGWLLACSALSLGQFLSASVLLGADCETRSLRFKWLTLVPHFQIDTFEARMGGRGCEFAVAMTRIAPVALACALAAWKYSAALFPLMVGLFYVIAPLGGSAAMQLIRSVRGAPRFSVQAGALFDPRRWDFWMRWQAWCADLRSGAQILSLAWALIWVCLIARLIEAFRPDLVKASLAAIGSDPDVLTTAKSAFVATIAAAALCGVALLLAWVQHQRLQRAAVRPLRNDASLPKKAALSGDIAEILYQVPLFKAAPKREVAQLVPLMRLSKYSKGENVFCEDAPGESFHVVIEGEFEILKRRAAPSRGMDVIGWFGPGDSFGDIALLEGTKRTATVRALKPSKTLELAKWDFTKVVAGPIGTARAYDLLQHAVFLGRLVFMAGWPTEDLVRFASCCTTHRYEAGAQVLRKGDANTWFYLIFDGAFEVRKGPKVIRRMQPGDYFGEISLMENGLATADVVALEESRCLLMHRNDFMSFFAHDYRISTRMEAIAMERLGSKIFVSK